MMMIVIMDIIGMGVPLLRILDFVPVRMIGVRMSMFSSLFWTMRMSMSSQHEKAC
jgi:hypothetical protein